MNSRQRDVLELLAAANPVPLSAVAGASQSLEARRGFVAITADATPPRGRGRVHVPQVSRRRRLLSTAVAATALAAIVATVVATVGPEGRLGAEPAAAQALLAASRVAGNQAAPLPAPGEYFYSRTRSLELTTAVADGRAWSTLTPSTVELWFSLDGSGRVREVSGETTLVGAEDRSDWLAAGSPPLQSGKLRSDRRFGPGGLSAGRVAEADLARLAALPTDGEELAKEIRDVVKDKGRPQDVGGLMFQEIASLLANPAATPELRAALFDAASRIEGVEFLGRAKDRAGRVGTLLGVDSAFGGKQTRYTMNFDPTSTQLLEVETVLLERVDFVDVSPPATIGYTTYVVSSLSPSLEEAPAE